MVYIFHILITQIGNNFSQVFVCVKISGLFLIEIIKSSIMFLFLQ